MRSQLVSDSPAPFSEAQVSLPVSNILKRSWIESNSGAIGPSGDLFTFFNELSKMSTNLRAFRVHSCLSVLSRELHRERIAGKHI